MEPVSVIIAALVAGAAKTAGEVAGDAYKGLKVLIQRKFVSAGKSGAEYVLAKHEEKPQAWQEPLKAELVEAGADKDEEIIKQAQELLKQLKPQEVAAGKFNLKVSGDVKGIVGEISGGTINQDIS
ncbi:MAG: hypothetical protein ACR9NN_24820 [Nostochopsis sp.]